MDELKIVYQNTQRYRKKIVANFRPSNEEFSLLEEIELLTVTLRGYANQIQAQGRKCDRVCGWHLMNSLRANSR